MTKIDEYKMLFYGSEDAPRLALGSGVYIIQPDGCDVHLGDRLRFPEVSDVDFEVLDLIFLMGHPYLHVSETEVGHRFIAKFNKSLGLIKHYTVLKFVKV